METEIHEGRPIQNRTQCLSIEIDTLESDLVDRVNAILDGVVPIHRGDKVAVLDSGINPELGFGPSEERLVSMDQPVVQRIGTLPELPEPTDDILAVVEAWERWLERYCEEALAAIERLNAEPPVAGKELKRFGKSAEWGALELSVGPGLELKVRLEDGAKAMRDALAGRAWHRAAQAFSQESVAAAGEATRPPMEERESWVEELGVEEAANCYLRRAKKLFAAAKAHDSARRAKVPDFDVEMKRWADEHGSDRLQLGIEDGYRMNARYLAERLAAEAPGFFAMPVQSAAENWALRATSPSEPALRLRRRVEAAIKKSAPLNLNGPPSVDILVVFKPPHEIYQAHEAPDRRGGIQVFDLPSKDGWPWHHEHDGTVVGDDPKPFEAVVVREWLGRFHLIGAVTDVTGSDSKPPGIWAIPDLACFHEDGAVDAQDPDGPAPVPAKRKPPQPEGDDDIPF